MNRLANKRGSTLGILAVLIVIFGASALAGFYLIGPGLSKRNQSEHSAKIEAPQPSPEVNVTHTSEEKPRPVKRASADDVVVSVSISEEKASPPPREAKKPGPEKETPETRVAGVVEEYSKPEAEKADKPKPTQPPATDAVAVQPPAKASSFRVQVGVFTDKQAADNLAKGLQAKGEQAHVANTTIDGKPAFRVQAGIFSKRENAESLSKKLKGEGFQPSIVEQPAPESAGQ